MQKCKISRIGFVHNCISAYYKGYHLTKKPMTWGMLDNASRERIIDKSSIIGAIIDATIDAPLFSCTPAALFVTLHCGSEPNATAQVATRGRTEAETRGDAHPDPTINP